MKTKNDDLLPEKTDEVPSAVADIDAELDKELDSEDTDIDAGLDNDWYGDGGGMGDGIPAMEKHTELLKQLMNFEPYLRTKFEKWVNIVWDEEQSEYVENKYGMQIMNKNGAHWSISFIDTYARNNNMITHISEEDYGFFKEDLIWAIWPNIYNRYEDFGIKEVGDCNRVCIEILHTALLVLMGSGDGKAAKILTDTTHRSENVNITNPQYQQPMGSMGMPVGAPPHKERFMAKLKRALGG